MLGLDGLDRRLQTEQVHDVGAVLRDGQLLVAVSPDRLRRDVPVLQRAADPGLELGGRLETAHDPEGRVSAVRPRPQTPVGPDLLVGGAVQDALPPEEGVDAGRVQLPHPQPPEPGDRDGTHRQRLGETGHCSEGVQDRQRLHAARHAPDEAKPDRAAEVVDHEVERLDAGGAQCLLQPRRQAGPGVVDVDRPLGEPEPGEVQRHALKPSRSERRQDLAIEVGSGRHPVETDDRRPCALPPGPGRGGAGDRERVAGGLPPLERVGLCRCRCRCHGRFPRVVVVSGA